MALNQNRLLPVIGAGISSRVGLPTWRGFLLQQRLDRETKETIRYLLREGLFELAAELVQLKLKGSFAQNTYVSLDDAHEDQSVRKRVEEDELLAIIVRLFPRLIATLNFDQVLPLAYELFGARPSQVRFGTEGARAAKGLTSEPRIIKLHGQSRTTDARVLRVTEYHAAYGDPIDEDKPLPQLIRYLYFNFELLFLGCSLATDRYVAALEWERQRERVTAKIAPRLRHFAVLRRPRSAAETFKRARGLESMGIQPIWVRRYEEIPDILREVERVARPRTDGVNRETVPIEIGRDGFDLLSRIREDVIAESTLVLDDAQTVSRSLSRCVLRLTPRDGRWELHCRPWANPGHTGPGVQSIALLSERSEVAYWPLGHPRTPSVRLRVHSPIPRYAIVSVSIGDRCQEFTLTTAFDSNENAHHQVV